jgi:TolB-like protein/DNA-binding winged helix-turn-helix (wHTH) protein/Tfp pilus assembly protein PilF
MESPSNGRQRLSFGPFEADLSSGELYKLGRRIQLQDQPFRVLAMLVQHPGEVVTREKLQKELWPDGTFVDFNEGLDTALKKLRHALGDSAQNPNFIETIPRRGYRLIGPVGAPGNRSAISIAMGGARPETVASRTLPWKLLVGVLALAVALAGVLVRTIGWKRRSTSPIRSIAVLPLENLSGDASQDYFADGLTDELITALGQINSLRVISRTSVMHYRNVRKPLSEIARELNVDAIVEGTFSRSGDQVRITAQLIQTQSEKQLWAQGYRRETRDVFGLQNEIASGIAKQVRRTLRSREQATGASQRTVSPEAYEAYWKGELLLDKLRPDSVQQAAEYFQEAIAKSPDYVAAYNKLAGSYQILSNMGSVPTQEGHLRAESLTARALEIDPRSGQAHGQKGWDALLYDLDFATAGAEFNRAVELNPNGVEGHQGLAEYYASVGQTDRAVLEIRRAQAVDPLSYIVNDDVCRMLYFSRRFDEALAQCKANLDLDPQLQRPLWKMGPIYAAKGLDEAAASVFLQAYERAGAPSAMMVALKSGQQKSGLRGISLAVLQIKNRDINKEKNDPFFMAVAYTYAGDKDKALIWLERAFDERSFGITYLGVDPTFDSLRSYPRFQNLVQRMRQPQ